jgi:amino acid adenylation domain-containing protein
VLVSSAVQYFPGPGYLRAVLHDLLVVLPAGARIVLADLLDPMAGQFPGSLRVPRPWWAAFGAGYPGLEVQVLDRDAAALDSPLRHRYDVVITVPPSVPAERPAPRRGSAERPWHWPDLPVGAVPAPPRAGDLAYTITTSGSTGEPKAVAVRHRSVVNLVDWFNRRNEVAPADVLLQVSAFTFDLSVYDIFGLLAAGGSLLLLPDSALADPARVVDAVVQGGVTLWNSAPAAFSLLLPVLRLRPGGDRSVLRRVFLSGDWVPLSTHADLAREFPRAVLVALGGATEACVWSNDFVVSTVDPDWTSVPYGHPMQNSRYYVLRPDGSPCAVGETGELHIAGECVAAGYLTDPELTAARFLADPWVPGERMYRTGDRARWTAAGWVEFLGRSDQQVKVRGFRVELGEVEQVARRLAGVSDAVAVPVGAAREPAVGLVVRAAGLPAELAEQEVREHLRSHLPGWMVPARLRVVASLPVSATGKVDRRAVADLLLAPPAPMAGAGRAARTGILGLLCAEFAGMLERAEVHPDDDFFEVGGNSLRAVRLVARLRERHGLPLEPADIFEHPSPRQLLALLDAAPAAARGGDLWQLVEAAARAHAGSVAVRDADPARQLRYRELLAAAAAQSAELAAAGVRAGDRVAVAARRSGREVVAVLAILRLGAAWVALAPNIPPRAAAEMLDAAAVRVVLGDRGRLAALGELLDGRVALPILSPAGAPAVEATPAVRVDGAAAACVTFAPAAAGPTGGTELPRSAVVGQAHDQGLLRPGAAARFLRLAPLGDAASALEIFVPLLAGRTVEVFPTGSADPDSLAGFLRDRGITGLWLPAGTLRQVANYRPEAFAGVGQLLTGGGVVPAAAVARVLRACPGLRITAGEITGDGPVARHVDDPAGAADLGRPAAAGISATIRGVPVAFDRVAEVLRQVPWVRDAAVAMAAGGQLVAGVVAPDDPALPEVLRAHAGAVLPSEAVPSMWAFVDELPRTADGGVDAAGLVRSATAADPVRRAARVLGAARQRTGTGAPARSADPAVALAVRVAWEEVLGTGDFGPDDEFYTVGGTSVRMLRLRGSLRQRLPHVTVTVQDLYRYPTVAALTAYLQSQSESEPRPGSS